METLIKPNRSWWRLDLRELWDYRDLLKTLIHRDFVTRFKQTILGPLLFVIQPLMQTLLLALVFGVFVRMPPEGIPAVLFYLAGLLGWGLVSGNFSATSNSLTANAHLYAKVYFPRLIPPLAVCVGSLLNFAVQFGLFLIFFAYYKWVSPTIHPLPSGLGMLWLPLFALHLLVLSLGMGLWVSALSAKFRDLTFFIGFLTQSWMYASPVIYPMSKVPEPFRHWLLHLNPVAPVLEAMRLELLGSGAFHGAAYALSAVISLAIFISGAMVFHRAERTFVDTV